MSLIVLQPAASTEAFEHYENTVKNPVSLEQIAPFLPEDVNTILTHIYPSGEASIWGVTPGKRHVNVNKWERISRGDTCLISKKGHIFASATITSKVHSRELAMELWGDDGKGNTWEYIYFLDEIVNQHISYEEFNNVAGYEPNSVIQGFSVLNELKSSRIFTTFDLFSELYYPRITENDYFQLLKTVEESDSLDRDVKGKARREQGFLRDQLFGNRRTQKCAICGKDYPVEFLVAAHIKKRCECTLDERKDYNNIVAPMCRFGCDELYERGFIGVNADGEVTLIQPILSEVIQNYLDGIIGKQCGHWDVNKKSYFSWHLEKHSKK